MFENELLRISNNEIVAFTSLVLQNAPCNFFTHPASSTSRYHPQTSNGYGGLIVHTKQVFYIAESIMDTRLDLVRCDRDIVLSSCLLHDIYKYANNESRYTVKNHGQKGVEFIEEIKAIKDYFSIYSEKPYWYNKIMKCIHSHNGIFSPEYKGTFSVEQSIVHIADYIASKKWCEFNVGVL